MVDRIRAPFIRSPHLRKILRKIRLHKVSWLIQESILTNLLVKKTQEPVPDLGLVMMGNPVISKSDWDKKKKYELSRREQCVPLFTLMSIGSYPKTQTQALSNIKYEVSVIVSIYRSGELLDSFLGNLREQSIFEKAEVMLVLVDPTNQERELCTKFAELNASVKIEVVNTRISIYSAWNLAIKRCSSPYITNMNIDDMRSSDSLEIQVKFMQSHPWIDVGYQDFFYLLDRDLDWVSMVNIGARSQTPAVTLTELAWFGINPPHNAPIWKRDLHLRFGLFDENLRSAGDYEFWMRIVSQGGIFAKMPESTVGYFINPDGMSTSVESPSTQEEQKLQVKYRSMINLKSTAIPEISLDENYLNHPWDGAEVLTEIVLDKLRAAN